MTGDKNMDVKNPGKQADSVDSIIEMLRQGPPRETFRELTDAGAMVPMATHGLDMLGVHPVPVPTQDGDRCTVEIEGVTLPDGRIASKVRLVYRRPD